MLLLFFFSQYYYLLRKEHTDSASLKASHNTCLVLFQIVTIVLKTPMLSQPVNRSRWSWHVWLSENEGFYVRNASNFPLPSSLSLTKEKKKKKTIPILFILFLCSFKKGDPPTMPLIPLCFFYGFATNNYCLSSLSSLKSFCLNIISL